MSQLAVLDRWYQAIKSGDADFLASVTTENVEVFWNGSSVLIPWAGHYQGRSAVLDFFSKIASYLTVVEIRTVDQFAAEGAIVVLCQGRWIIRENGVAVTTRMANVFKFNGEHVAAFHVYNDTAAFFVGLGVRPIQTDPSPPIAHS